MLGLAALVVAAVGFAGWNAFRVWWSWRSIPRVEFDPGGVRAVLGTAPQEDGSTPGPGAEPPPTDMSPIAIPDEAFDTFLVIGSDETEYRENIRADSILLFLWPTDGRNPVLTSLPRDLVVASPCNGEPYKLSLALEGCGARASGPEVLALAVEDFTGVPVDHFVLFAFEGFTRVIDKLGGVEICVAHAVRNIGQDPLLPAGCSVADGETTLAWLRSRTTEELVDGEWRPLEGDGDLLRTQRQQDVLLQMLGKLHRFRSPHTLATLAKNLSDAFVLDDGLSLSEAVVLAWDLRGVNADSIARPQLEVEAGVLPDGTFGLLPNQSFTELLATVYPSVLDLPHLG